MFELGYQVSVGHPHAMRQGMPWLLAAFAGFAPGLAGPLLSEIFKAAVGGLNRSLMPLTPGTTDEFVAIAVKSGLRNAEELRNALAAFRREVRRSFETSLAELRAFRDYLVHNDVLTRWQCENLSAGRYKGFFIGCLQAAPPSPVRREL